MLQDFRMRRVLRGLAAIVLLVSGAPAVFGQIDRGTITGTVRDSSGAVIAQAKVQIIQTQTNNTIDLSTNDEGLYFAPNLPASVYRIVVRKEGFSSFLREPVEVIARSEARVDVTLQPGSVSESVSVSAESPLLDTAAVNNSATLAQNMIDSLPLFSVGLKRDITGFLNNLPGTTNTSVWVPSVNGAPGGQTEVFVDGAPSAEVIVKGSAAETGPLVETVGEVSVVTNAFNAEYGGFGNWFTNATLKSGTNSVHGSMFDHLGNSALNARNFFLPTKMPYKQNEGGFTVGGPIVIPHVYNGRNKTFFFGSLGLFFSRVGSGGNIVTIPTPSFLKGDFSALKSASGALIPIFDPNTTVADGNGSYTRTAFPGNVIPASRITTAGNVLAGLFPSPDFPTIFNNYFDRSPSGVNAGLPWFDLWDPLIKIDHNISNKQKLQGSFVEQIRHRELWGPNGPPTLAGIGSFAPWGTSQTNPLSWQTDQIADSYQVRLNYDYIITPTLLNHITLNGNRYWNFGLNKTQGQGWDQKLGVTGIPYNLGEFPQMTFSGGTAAPVVLNRAYDEYWHDFRSDLSENLTWIRGKHTMKFGASIEKLQVSENQTGGASGNFTFNNNMTSLPDSPSYSQWGNAYASFLLGSVGTASAYVPAAITSNIDRYAIFAQDEWRMTPKLTLYYGLRYDYQPPFTERHNKISSFQPNLVNPGAGGLLGALAFAGTGQGLIGSSNFLKAYDKGFAPRLGVAYQMNQKTVVRASSGIYYGEFGGSIVPNAAGFNFTPTFSSADGFTPLYNYATQTFPQNFERPPSLDPSFLNGQSISYYLTTAARMPQILNWTFSIQRQLVSNLSIEVTYLGSHSTHLNFSENYDYLPLSGLKYGSLLLSAINSPAAANAGFSSPFPAFVNQVGANNVYQALRPYPQFKGVTASSQDGAQKFDSLQTKVNKRYSGGLTIFGFVTWSKSFSRALGQFPGSTFWQLDPNPALTMSTNFVYELPFGKGRKMLSGASHPVNALVSGWKVSGLLKYASGIPLNISGGGGFLGSIGYTQWATAVPGTSPYLTTDPRDFNPATNRYLNPAAFQVTTGFNFGTLAPNASWIRGFWSKQEQVSVARTFSIAERVKLDFSVDASNPFNFVRWMNPNLSLTSAAFGTVSSANDPRILQVNAVVRF